MTTRQFVIVTAALTSIFSTQAVFAGAHTWKVNEVFSNASGSIQFIELRESGGGNFETNINGLQVRSLNTGSAFAFPSDIAGPTGFRHLLLATQSFADLPGAPTPNYIIPPNFFTPGGDRVSYHVYDSWTFGAVPTNCTDSLHRTAGAGANSPTNYASQSGNVNACPALPCPADCAPPGGDGSVNVTDLLAVINGWGACSPPPASCAADVAPGKGDGQVNVTDLLAVINGWGTCP